MGQFLCGPLLGFGKPRVNFPFGMLGFTEFHGHVHALLGLCQVYSADHQVHMAERFENSRANQSQTNVLLQ